MFRFTIRDVLWLTVVVAVAITLWLGWSRETSMLRKQNTALEVKLTDEVAAERAKAAEKTRELLKKHLEVTVKAKMQEAVLERQGIRVNYPPE
jgi:hypothetical protein